MRWIPLLLLFACDDGGASAVDAQPAPDEGIASDAALEVDAELEADAAADASDPGLPGEDLSYGMLNPEQFQRMLNPPEGDGPFYMINLMRFRDRAVYADGRETELTGREANELYAPIEFLSAIGAYPVFVSDVERQLLGMPGWHQIGIVRYPSRALFLQMTQDAEFQARAVHKDAGLEKSIVMVAHLLPSLLPEDFEPVEPMFPASEEDPPFEMIHLLAYHDVAHYEEGSGEPERSGREAMELYQQNAGGVATPWGVYPRAWFDIEGVLIGDGRDWHEFRINHFPSHATFDALVGDQGWRSGVHHREAALADTFALQTLPIFTSL